MWQLAQLQTFMDVDVSKSSCQSNAMWNNIVWTIGLTKLDSGDWLGSNVITYYLQLLKRHGHVNGLYNPALISLCSDHIHLESNYVQVLNTGSNHWICVSYSGALGDSVVNLYDSMRTFKITEHVGQQVMAFAKFDQVLFRVINVQQQRGSSDCGLFATALCLGQDLTNFQFDQTAMRTHLKSCLIKGSPQMFPNDLRRISGRLTAPIVPFYGQKDYNPEFPIFFLN